MALFRKTYAQNREDIILEGFFDDQETGFYVDVGANHPTMDSVTKLFYDKGWSGINLEPNKALYELLLIARPRDINLQIGIADKAGELTIREYPDGHGLSTFSKEMQKSYEDNPSDFTARYQDYKVKIITLNQLFSEQKVKTIDFMKVDVEGLEFEVLAGNDWKAFRPKVLCIEANHIDKDWRPLLKEHGYNLVFSDGLNNYYVAQECSEISKRFSYVDTVLLKPVPVYAEFYDKNELVNWQLAQESRKLARQEILVERLNNDVMQLNHQIVSQRRIRSLLKQLVQAIHGAVSMQINKLDKPKVYKSAKIPVLNDNRSEMLKAVQAYDFQRYYGASTRKPLSYTILHGLYRGVSRGTYKALRGLYSIVRRRRHA